jgi:response regulator of citrate/malate metabolism
MEHHEASEAALQHGYLLSQAEARLLYGESGRPERSYG